MSQKQFQAILPISPVGIQVSVLQEPSDTRTCVAHAHIHTRKLSHIPTLTNPKWHIHTHSLTYTYKQNSNTHIPSHTHSHTQTHITHSVTSRYPMNTYTCTCIIMYTHSYKYALSHTHTTHMQTFTLGSCQVFLRLI